MKGNCVGIDNDDNDILTKIHERCIHRDSRGIMQLLCIIENRAFNLNLTVHIAAAY